MISNFGLFIRKIRRNNNETMINMAKRLDLSIVELSELEVGRKIISRELFEKIINDYKLDNESIVLLNNAINETNNEVDAELMKMSQEQKDTSFIFTRRIKSSNNLVDKLREVLNND